MLGRIADQAARIAHLVHHLIAGIDAGGTADALVLQSIANVDVGRADLDADAAVDTGTLARRLVVLFLGTRAARFAALGIIGHDQRVMVEHRALETGVGTHVLADLFAHPAGVAIGGKAVEQDPEGFPRTEAKVEAQHLVRQGSDRREITDEGEPGPQSQRNPDAMLGRLESELARGHRLGIELHARISAAFDLLLDPHEDLGVDGLRASIAAEQAPADGGEQEQGVGGDDKEDRQVKDILRPEDQAENVKLALGQFEQHCLASVPGQPAEAVEYRLGNPDEGPAPGREPAADGAHMDILARLVERLHRGIRIS